MTEQTDFSHETVLLREAVEALNVHDAGCYADCTFGRGGHSRSILAELGESGLLIGIDKDPEAERVGRALNKQDSKFVFARGSFTQLKEMAGLAGCSALDGVLMDLGVSSPQLDDATRGFSFLKDGPLDMRMNSEQGQSAAQWLAKVEESELARVLWEYGEERYSRRIAKAIVNARSEEAVVTTKQLAEIVSAAHPKWEKNKHPATRSFQAIRIHINAELEDLKQGLETAYEMLSPGGRLVVISFHSLEDRLVKRFMQDKVKGPQLPKWIPIVEEGQPKAKIIAKKVKASDEEVAANVRSRSAVMRVLERTE